MPLTREEPIIYRIDETDTICELSKNWLHFASFNQADQRCQPEHVIGQPIDSFIENEATQCLYRMITDEVRNSGEPVSFPFRCDAPDIRRFLELTVVPLQNNHIEFRSQLLWSERRQSIHLLRKEIDRSDQMLPVCSICKKIELNSQWYELERAIDQLGLGETLAMPTLSHGYCPACFEMIKQSIHNRKAPQV